MDLVVLTLPKELNSESHRPWKVAIGSTLCKILNLCDLLAYRSRINSNDTTTFKIRNTIILETQYLLLVYKVINLTMDTR